MAGPVTRAIAGDAAYEPPTEWTLDAPVLLIQGTSYVIVVSAPDIRNTLSYGVLWEHSGSNEYADGLMSWSDNSGSSWTTTAWDFDFEVLGVFSPAGVIPADVTYTKKLVAVANNQLWYESTPGTMTELAAATDDINCADLLNIFEGYGKVFVANKDNLKVADFQNKKITTADVVSGGVYPQFGAYLTGGTSGAAMSVDYITSLSGACTLYGANVTGATFVSGETVTGINPDESSISFS